MKTLLLAILLGVGPSILGAVVGLPEGGAKCPVCRMDVTSQSKTVYSATREAHGKKEPLHLCSYSCAHAFHAKRPEGELFAHDFETGEAVPSADAWYLVKSKKIDGEVEFGMAPIVAAFKDEARAKALQEKLKDGKVVHGLAAVEKTYRK
jgi:hypothetical protein